MAVKKYDVVAITGEYTNAQGETKKRYVNCGAVFQTDKGFSLKLESLPVGADWNGWLSLYEPKPRNQQQQPKSAQQSDPFAGQASPDSFGGGQDDDSIPF